MKFSSDVKAGRPASLLRSVAVAAAFGAAALSANASSVVFDSYTNPFIAGGFAQTKFAQCLWCVNNPIIEELGDIITLAGTDRVLEGATVVMAQASASTSYTADISLKFYTPDGATLLASDTQTVFIAGATGAYDIVFDFTSSPVTLPDTVYYGVSVTSVSLGANDLWLGLWDYWSLPEGGDGQALTVGTDPGTTINGATNVSSIMYGRLASNPSVLANSNGTGLGANDLDLGFTPNIQIVAAPIPEPATYGMFALGLLGVGAMVRRSSKKAA